MTLTKKMFVINSLLWLCVLPFVSGDFHGIYSRSDRSWPYGQSAKPTLIDRGEGTLRTECIAALDEAMDLPGLMHLNYSKLDVMLDSVGKPGSGLLSRNLLWYGSYQQCAELSNTKYCLNTLRVNLTALSTDYSVVRIGICLPSECHESDAVNFLWSLDTIVPERWRTEYSVLKIYMDMVVDKNATESVCETHSPVSGGPIATMVICSCIVVLLVIGSIVDWYISQPQQVTSSAGWMKTNRSVFGSDIRRAVNTVNNASVDETDPLLHSAPGIGYLSTQVLSYPGKYRDTWYVRALRCFSLQRSLQFVLDTKHNTGTIPCLHGIRVFSMGWVILGHTYLWPLFVGCSNPREMSYMTSQFSFQLVLNSTFAVDSFFVLSGMLVMFWTLRRVDSGGGSLSLIKFYVHRFLRLTPAYMFVLMLWANVVQYWGNAPSWESTMADQHICRKYWWTNLLYINNFFPLHLKLSCLGWTWYLALDMQFYIISPLVILIAYRYGSIGLSVIVGLLLSGSLVATALIVHFANLRIDGASLLINDIFSAESQIIGDVHESTVYQSSVFDKPYCRIASYLVGLVVGFLVRRLPAVSTTSFSKAPARWFALVGWALAIFLCLCPIYGLYSTYHSEDELSHLATIIYYTFSRLSWSVGVGWVILACFAGYGGYINSFFSHGLWLPLSRLTFSTYLVHPIVLYLMFLGLEMPVYYTNVSMITYYLASLVASYAAAFILLVCVEVPFVELEKLLVSH